MNAKPPLMKTFLACFLLAASFIRLHAQSPTVSVDVRYRIDPKDSSVPAQQFFVSRLDNGFSYFDKKALLELTAMRIWQKTHDGDSILNYNPAYDLFPGFSSSTLIADCKMIAPADFSKPSGQIGDQSWLWVNSRDYFKLKNGKVTAGNLTVQADKKIAYAVDTLLTEDVTNGLMIPLLSYRYLEPEQVSLFFTERWSFDLARGHMEKSVRYYGYYLKKFTYAGDFVGYAPTLCIKNPEPASPKKQTLIKKNVVCDVAVNWPEQMLKNDTNMQRYAGADAVSYLTIAEGNVPEGERSKMLAAIFNFALNNPKNVCAVKGTSIDSLHPFNTAKDIQALFVQRDSIQVEDPANPGVWTTGLLEKKFSLGDVYAIRFYEDWYYDEKDFAIKKVVRGIGFVMMGWGNMGLPVLSDAGIYIKLN
jgi:hypothetical protein